eukprot:6483060-Amphidinium_carterae.1
MELDFMIAPENAIPTLRQLVYLTPGDPTVSVQGLQQIEDAIWERELIRLRHSMEAHARAIEGLAMLTGTLPNTAMHGQAFMVQTPALAYVVSSAEASLGIIDTA